jgi:Na+-transporting NADH:ubiquinone oxidoreductase subunit C
MDTNGNKYTIIYASVMVVIVAVMLSIAATQLKPFQDANILIEKKQNILRSVNIVADAKQANDLFSKTIKEMYIVNSKGEKVEGDAFKVDLKVEHSKHIDQRKLPVYVADMGEKGKVYIIPLRGAGLWGPIWGYVALQSDMNTIYGANFDHQGETPGLGAEINTEKFQKPFIGKTIFDQNCLFTSVIVAKTGEKSDPAHSVDAISGGTITSKGLQKMLYDDLSTYQEFIKKLKK